MPPESTLTQAIHRHILRTFAETAGPPSPDALLAAFDLTDTGALKAHLAALEHEGHIYRDPADGGIHSAYPFSAVPTAHRVRLESGVVVYAMCAIDALGIPFMLGQDVTISSRCAQCNAEILVEVKSRRIAVARPATLIVVYAAASEECCAATDQCPYINFFCSPEHASAWQAAHPALALTRKTLAQALEGGRRGFERLLAADP